MKQIISLALAAALLTASLAACGPSSGDKQIDLAAFARTVQENHEFSGFLERVDPEGEMGEQMTQMLDRDYPGLSGLELEQMEVYMSMVSFSGGELALVQAKNAGDAARVKEIFDARVAAKTTEGPGNYPEEAELWQHNSVIVSRGNYVMLVTNDDSTAIVSEFNALFS